MFRSLSSIAGQPLAPTLAPDSLDSSPTLTGQSRAGRESLVEQAGGLALRVGQWKYIEPSNRPRMNTNTNTELGNDTVPQLYDLAQDPGETRNLAPSEPARVQAMVERLAAIRRGGR